MGKGKNTQVTTPVGAGGAPSKLRQQGGRKEGKRKKRSGNKANKGLAKSISRFTRGEGNDVKHISDKKLQGQLRRVDEVYHEAAEKAARADVLLAHEAGYVEAEGMERTYKFTQDEIRENVGLNSASKIFNLDLPEYGPYVCNYSRSGQHLAIAGAKGHVALLDWQKKKPLGEVHLRETVRDVCFLHNHTMLALAQKKYVYIYDSSLMELHCLRKQFEVNKMAFLPYHFLLTTVSSSGMLRYLDTSTGEQVAEFRTRLGPCSVLTTNPRNAVVHLGHTNGTVTLWTPNIGQARVKILCHRGPLTDIAISRDGLYMATSGLDGQVAIWDVRKYTKLHSYYSTSPASTLDISDTGLLSVGYGTHVQIWRDALATKASAPYLTHHTSGRTVHRVQYCPYEDVLGVGHDRGFESIVVPGAGEANYDSFTANPNATVKQRREAEIQSLLEKISPQMITLEADVIGNVDRAPAEVLARERRLAAEAQAAATGKPVEKKKARGRNKYAKRLARKSKNVIDKNRELLREKLEKSRKAKDLSEREQMKQKAMESENPISRFF